MSLKTRLRISIVALAAFIVVALSALYLYDFGGAAFQNASNRAEYIAKEINVHVMEQFDQTQSQRPRASFADVVREDATIASLLKRARANDGIVVNISISGDDGRILAASDPTLIGTPLGPTSNLDNWGSTRRMRALWELFTRDRNYAVPAPLGLPGQTKPIVTTTVVVSALFIRNSLANAFYDLALAFAAALLASIALALLVPHWALRPLERLGTRIDLIRTGQFSVPDPAGREAHEFAIVQAKLNLLGQQFRGARDDVMELRGSIERLLQGLDEAVLIFDSNGRLAMAGKPVERLFGRTRGQLLGQAIADLFPASTALGALIAETVERGRPVRERLVPFEWDAQTKTQLLANIEPMAAADGALSPGVLVTLRDAETRRQLEAKLDLSSRLAAISRLMGGVAHEIKNPLNAIALHLEVLKSKLTGSVPEIDVIAGEIRRLDQVVKTFLNFNRPVELHLQDFDLSAIARETAALVAPAAREKVIAIQAELDTPLWIRGDPELLRQAVLNVVSNGIEAMPDGGRLTLKAEVHGGECILDICDSGTGIAPEVQDKIFNLYFTTKKGGSGIGLALTFRMVQLHNGTIDFVTGQNLGTTFRLRFPETAAAALPA